MKNQSRQKCISIAFNHENLFPPICMDIISDIYGKRAEWMKPKTLLELVMSMMLQVTDTVDESECMEAVQEWINIY